MFGSTRSCPRRWSISDQFVTVAALQAGEEPLVLVKQEAVWLRADADCRRSRTVGLFSALLRVIYIGDGRTSACRVMQY